jgi:hypothetical protein
MSQTTFSFMRPALPTSTFEGCGDDLAVVDLCCGCGMASLGLLAAGGFNVVAGVDAWYEATEAFYLNVSPDDGGLTMFRDEGWSKVESALQALQFEHQVDVVLTGPPCQDDSRANQGADRGRGEVKAPALEVARALNPTWIIMEMVTSKWSTWCREQGARQILKLQDCRLGGFTTRTRWFAIWGPADLQIKEEKPRGWGEAFPRMDTTGCVLATEANNNGKRWRLAKAPHEPAGACVGGDRRHVLRYPDGEEVRLGPCDEAALSGFPQLQLNRVEHMCDHNGERLWVQGANTEREANTMVGNGWPRSFGFAIGRAIMEAQNG